ncbi:hypothetical protein EW026_g7927 [Hermanssonia centrifuga]|uniref:Uncharacterized protein n=1 Tax=Hermanssonia centrifuga TaxID=98765 RepID=A0A4S4KAJ6_9APHY|nr:hypothetical protein EW026_g7927 [Hermanssonia centrifuga]
MWIGRIPWEMQVLTAPEQLLIALVHPRIYVFKMYPKNKHFRPDPASLQRGMRGNVSTYAQDIDGVTSMVEGRLLPQPLELLSSVITITYIGKGQLPKPSLHSTFHVRREVVCRALHWLKLHNPKYYGRVSIDESRLALYPDDGVPMEIEDVIRHTTDTGLVDEENVGYVPDEDGALDDTPIGDSDNPDVIPFQVSGSVDTDLTKMTSTELMLWGMSNLWTEGREGAYSVRHGRRPVRDLPPRRPSAHDTGDGEGDDMALADEETLNYFERAFPGLFPYGRGGIEAERMKAVDFSTHVRWTLQYHDRRFRKHETFPFVAFGIKQKRDALAHASIQMRRRDFEQDAHAMADITIERLKAAVAEEEKRSSYLRCRYNSRYCLRSEIWSTSIALGPPALWSTINLNDSHDPLAQAFCGEQINLDDFIATMGPDKEQRARNIAGDPYGAGKFFHFTLNAILETLLQVKVSKYQVKSDVGIFGKVSAYFGTVEAQGRGTLHLHMLIWLKNAPSSDELLELLKSEVFRDKMRAFIKANVRAYCPGLESAESVKAIRSDQAVGFTRPPNPDSTTYADEVKTRELALARTLQVHTCQMRQCLQFDKQGKLVCKRKAPWATANEDFVDESGQWGAKRLYAYVNGWNPSILLYARCNNDCKLLTNGRDTKNLSYYVTSYAAKKQGRGFSMSAILAQGYAYHVQHPRADYVDSLRDTQRLLIFRLVHSINREQELSGAMVMSYLMGWGDVYRSHQYTAVFWSSFVSALTKAFPDVYTRPATAGHERNEPVEVANNHGNHEAEAQLPQSPTRGVQPADDGAGHGDDGPDQSTLVRGHKFICMAVVF